MQGQNRSSPLAGAARLDVALWGLTRPGSVPGRRPVCPRTSKPGNVTFFFQRRGLSWQADRSCLADISGHTLAMPVGQQAVADGQATLAEEAGRVESAHAALPGDGDLAKPAFAASVSNIAWAIVALAFFSDALAMGGRSFFAVVLPLWEVEFGWSRSYVSSAMSFVHVFQGLGA